MDFISKLEAAQDKNNSLLCVGLDPDQPKLPPSVNSYFEFNKAIVDATADLVCAYKPNTAFYEARGAEGIEELKQTCDYIRISHPEIPIILDFKRGDIGNTNNHYAKFAFEYLGADAVTVNPWSGQEGMQAFLDYKDRGIFVWCKGSNPGSEEFQDIETVDGKKLYKVVADNVVFRWNDNGNCMLVMGGTYPEELKEIRDTLGILPLLIPGIGHQGGDLEATLTAGLNNDGKGLIISTSRAVIYAHHHDYPDYAEAARHAAQEMRDKINKHRETK